MIYRLQKRMILICGGSVILVFTLLFLLICAASFNQLNTAIDGFIDSIADNGGRLPEADLEAENLQNRGDTERGGKLQPTCFPGNRRQRLEVRISLQTVSDRF